MSIKSVFGALLVLESLSQLVRFDAGPARAFFVGSAPWAISDAPRFSHRELLLDTSRHYLPLRALEQMIATLPAAKINVLHWHLTDDQSVALCSRALPKLCEAASFSRDERYTLEDLKRVVAFARLHVVRVMVEAAADSCGASASTSATSRAPAGRRWRAPLVPPRADRRHGAGAAATRPVALPSLSPRRRGFAGAQRRGATVPRRPRQLLTRLSSASLARAARVLLA